MPSPFQLTWIRDLPESSNVDAVSLSDILGDPIIAECWDFNYLHDLDFLMDAFDQDVRGIVRVNVVHGFWKNEDQSRLALKVLLDHVHILYKI
jgi:tyrosyl-DNA phosphodiesterase-1